MLASPGGLQSMLKPAASTFSFQRSKRGLRGGGKHAVLSSTLEMCMAAASSALAASLRPWSYSAPPCDVSASARSRARPSGRARSIWKRGSSRAASALADAWPLACFAARSSCPLPTCAATCCCSPSL